MKSCCVPGTEESAVMDIQTDGNPVFLGVRADGRGQRINISISKAKRNR